MASFKETTELTQRQISQKAYRARKIFKQSLTELDEQISSGAVSSEQMQAKLNLRESIIENLQQSYATSAGEYLIDIDKLAERAQIARQSVRDYQFDENMRKNKMFERELNQASVGGISTKSKEEVKVFYTMTREFWEGSDISVRNKKIISAFGADTLEEVWDIVMENEDAKKALEMAKQAQKKAESESTISDGSTDEQDQKGSPEYIKWLITQRDTSREALIQNE